MSRDHMPHVGVHDASTTRWATAARGWPRGWRVARKVQGSKEGGTPFDATPFPAVPLHGGRPWFLPFHEAYHRLLDWRDGRG